MVRDPGATQTMRPDLVSLDRGGVFGLTERPMFGELPFVMTGNMPCAAREGRAMPHVGPHAGENLGKNLEKLTNSAALSFPVLRPMVRVGQRESGKDWRDGRQPDLDDIRARLNGLGAHERAQPAAEGVKEC